MDNNYYVYVHYIKLTGRIFYVGKGKNNRAWSSDQRNQYWKNTANKYDWAVKLVFENLTEEEALLKEKAVISKLGRENLTNMTDGGDGFSQGHTTNIGRKHTDETKNKISSAKKNKPSHKKGKKLTEIQKQAISKGKSHKIKEGNIIYENIYAFKDAKGISKDYAYKLINNKPEIYQYV